MWVRKTYVDLEKEKAELDESISKNSLKKAIKRFFYFLFGTFLFLILEGIILGPEFLSYEPIPSNPIKIKELPEYLDIFLIVSLIIATLVLLFSLFVPKYFIRDYKTTLICNKCFKVKNPDNETKCECGGSFENISLYKWVSEDEQIDMNEEK
jgi:hypothetical protein